MSSSSTPCLRADAEMRTCKDYLYVRMCQGTLTVTRRRRRSASQSGAACHRPRPPATRAVPTVGWPDQSGRVLWCAPYEKLQQKLPALPQSHGQGVGVDYECVDLTVTITCGNITEVDLEGLSLAETFSALGRREEAQAAKRLLGAPAETASEPLADLLASLLKPIAD